MSEIYSTYYQSPIGLIRISATEDVITELSFVDNIEKPPADHKRKKLPPVLIHAIEQLIEYFNGQRKTFAIPLHQEGTEFQKKVWSELHNIPFGKTVSYLELSKRIGDAKAIRAVGSTNGKNKIAIIVPCHRVIGSDGSLVGYAGGTWRKKWLLEHEAKYGMGIQTLF